MAKKESQLLPLLAAGSIKYPEEYSKIQVNCNPEDEKGGSAAAGRSPLENVTLKVLFPDKQLDTTTPNKGVIPLVGGAIVKLELAGGTEVNTNKPKITGTFDTSKLAAYISDEIPHVPKKPEDEDDEQPFVSISNLAKVRVNINKTLENMPALTTEWHECDVPSLVLSKTRTKDYPDTNALQKEIDEKQPKKQRIKEFGRPVGYFKFIPVQVLSNLYKALLSAKDDEDYGMKGEYYGISGTSFSILAQLIEAVAGGDDLDDKDAVKILLDIFPIIRLRSRDITGSNATLPNIGYYTAHKDSLYVKMPDLSGRDSNGYSQNIYGLGPESDSDIRWAFELVKNIDEYTAKAFDFQPPPVPEVKDGSAEFPILGKTTETSITILKEGLDRDYIDKYKFFLSPILPAGSSTSSRGFMTTDRAVEIFTAPVLTAPYLPPAKSDDVSKPVVTFPEKVVSQIIYEFSEKVQTGKLEKYNLIFNDASLAREQVETSDTGKLTHLEFSAEKDMLSVAGKHYYGFEELGIPMSENLSDFGIDNIADILGEANRPEILLGFRDGKGPERANEGRLYDPKVYGAKNLLASNRPNIILNEITQIPAMWIPLELKEAIAGLGDDDFYTLEISNMMDQKRDIEQEGPRSSLEIYNEMGFPKFALYVVDHMGQIVRAPGKNISLVPNSPLLSFAEPNGFSGANGGVPINLGTTLHPGLTFFTENTLTGLCFKGEGFVGTNPIINFYSDKAGKDLVASLKEGVTVGIDGHKIRVRDTSKDTVCVETFGTFGDILPALVGTFYVGIQLPTGVTSNLKPFYISEAGIKPADLPAPADTKITFRDSFGLEVEGFDQGVHSIPIIQDAVNHAKITIKAEKKTFINKADADAKLFAYIAVLKNDINKNILSSDVGWLLDEGHKGGSIVEARIKTSLGQAESKISEFYIPTELEWQYNTDSFKRDSAKKVTIKFPGDNMDINLSRFTELTAGDNKKESPAYILLTNSALNYANIPSFLNGGTDEKPKFDYAVIPIGSPGDKNKSEPAFTSVPEILGFVAELPSDGGDSRIVSNIPKASLESIKEVKEKIEGGWWSGGMSLDSIKSGNNQTLSIISSDALARLAIIFKGNEVPRMEKTHQASIGGKSLKDDCVDVEYAANNIIVASYKNITGIKSEGWTDVVIKKTDERFKCSYDSTLYNKVTTHVAEFAGMGIMVGLDDKLLPVPPATEAKNLLISKVVALPMLGEQFVDNQGEPNLSSVIFPGGVGKFSPLPLIPYLSMDPTKPASDTNAYLQFSNPVKIKPSLDMVFGESVSKDGNVIVHGMALTDAQLADNNEVVTEIIKINKNGQTSVAMGLLDMVDAIEKAKKEAEAVIQNIKANIAKMKAELSEEELKKANKDLAAAEANYNETSDNAKAAANNAEKSFMSKADADKAAMDAAMAGAQPGGSEGGDSSAVDALNDAAAGAGKAAAAAMGAVGDAVDGINDALGMLKMISDALSSIADIANQIADGVEEALAGLGSRPNDFVKVNTKYIYIDKDTVISSSAFKAREDKKEFKLTTRYKFSQASAIKFNVPEIVEVRKEKNGSPYLPFGDRPFSKLTIRSGDKLYIKVIGADDDTKFEVAGKRVDATKDSPASEGIFQNFIITVPPMSAFSIFGTGDCISITATNSNSSRMRLGRQMGNNLTLNLEGDWNKKIFGGGRNKEGPQKDIAKFMEDLAYLKFCNVKLSKAMGGAKEDLQSFCDFSFKLTAELSLQLRNLQVLLIPVKVIFCIIDVICALLNPWRLAFAIIRLFLCLYDLILLLPQLAVPAMFLALLLHLLNLLLCVILKILGWVNAINEIITALDRAIEYKNYPAIAALEEAINEHLFSLETDISVLEPIITILNLFLQLLQLAFAFPCRVGRDDDDEACIDPSQMVGLILGKLAPTGAIAPNVLLPLAQAYTRLPPEQAGYYGNSPPEGRDKSGEIYGSGDIWTEIASSLKGFDVVVRPQDENLSVVARLGTPGEDIPNMMNMQTGEMNQIQEGGYFQGDSDGDGNMDNIYYPRLRTQFVGPTGIFDNIGGTQVERDFEKNDYYFGANNGFFDATFSLSYTKGTKEWGWFTGPDPRMIRFNFNSGGVTSDIAWWSWWWIFPIFFSKKTVSAIQTIDSKPMFLGKNDNGDLIVNAKGRDFVSPIDGATGFLKKVGSGYQPKPLTVTFELNEPAVDDEFNAVFIPKMVTKTFGNIPMIAIVDDDFNVYFVEKHEGNGGIKMSGNSIGSMHLKMLNKPSAPKHKTGRQKNIAFSNRAWWKFDSFQAETAAWLAQDAGNDASSDDNWATNTSSKHEVGPNVPYPGGPNGDLLEIHPVSKTSMSKDNYYKYPGPVNEITGQMEYEVGDSKFGVGVTGEAVMQATANASWLKTEAAESEDLYYNGKKVEEYMRKELTQAEENLGFTVGNPQAPSGAKAIEYILHTTSKWRYNRALRSVWGHEPDTSLGDAEHPEWGAHGVGLPGERVTQTLKNKTVTFTLSNQTNDNTPYDAVKEQAVIQPGEPNAGQVEWVDINSHNPNADADDKEPENGDPYWPVGSKHNLWTPPVDLDDWDDNRFGPIEIHIVPEEEMYNPTENPGVGAPGRFEIKWTQELDDNIPYPKLGMAYDFGGGSNWERGDIGDSITAVKTYDFPQFYIVDMRQLADDIAAACGASGPAELLMDLPGFEEPFEDNVQEMLDCMEAFMRHFDSEELDENGVPQGMVPQMRYKLANGILPGKISAQDALDHYEVLKQCVNEQIDQACRFVVNPLNTGFKLLGDTDETPLPAYIDPEQEDLNTLINQGIVEEPEPNQGIVDELEFDDNLAGFPSITGAMEYASGIGDTIIAEVESKALIEILPRESDDSPMSIALDLREKIEVDFVTDETGGAKLVGPEKTLPDELVIRDEDKYILAVTTLTPGKVVIKGSICGVTIQAVTDKGIVSGQLADSDSDESAESLEGCIEDAIDDGTGDASDVEDDTFAPGSLMKVDRLLTILFVPKGAAGATVPGGMGGPGGLYGDSDRDASARSAKPSPQTSGTKLEN
jgi:hypothetical protein